MDEEEFERLHEDELELLKDLDGFDDELCRENKAKKCLDFVSLDKHAAQLGEVKSHSKRLAEDSILSEINMDYENAFKRKKTNFCEIPEDLPLPDECNPDYIIWKIQQLRKEKEQDRFMKRFKQSSNSFYREKAKLFTSFPGGACFPMLTSQSELVYLSMKSDKDLKLSKNFKNNSGLLLQPFSELKSLVMQQNDVKDGLDEVIEIPPNSEHNVSLWVEKYKPLHYLELLSDEGTNRTLLHWLKLWDKVVFGREVPVSRRKEIKGKYKLSSKQAQVEDLDASGLPTHRIALLCGNPGLGKTTLAHIVVTHAGYNAVEMNASDDRSPAIFLQQIEAATEMRSVLTLNSKPNCLIIDEIDGASSAAVKMLVSVINGKKSIKKNKSFLRRPIICICNDQYSPSLKPLKEHALIIKFVPTSPEKLVERLKYIMDKENMRSNTNALLSLANKTGCDIRSCLGTLQFLSKMKNFITSSVVENMSVGLKDMHKTYFDLWLQVFSIPRDKGKVVQRSSLENESNMITTNKSRFEAMLSQCQSIGEYEKVYQGLFENYLDVKFKDHNLESVTLGSEWLCFYDLLQADIMHKQHYALYPYQAFPCVMFHFLFAVLQRPVLKFPTKQMEFISKQSQLNNIVLSLMGDMSIQNKRMLSVESLIMDTIPLLLWIIAPQLRSVNSQLYSTQEKTELENLIKIMVEYNLTYRQERGLDGQYQYVIEPNIEMLCQYDKLFLPRRHLPYTTRQMIARSVELEKVKSSETLGSTSKEAPTPAVVVEEKMEKIKKITNNDPVDFFGRKIEITASQKDSGAPITTNMWFHFKEGYSNAVKKTVRIRDLL